MTKHKFTIDVILSYDGPDKKQEQPKVPTFKINSKIIESILPQILAGLNQVKKEEPKK